MFVLVHSNFDYDRHTYRQTDRQTDIQSFFSRPVVEASLREGLITNKHWPVSVNKQTLSNATSTTGKTHSFCQISFTFELIMRFDVP